MGEYLRTRMWSIYWIDTVFINVPIASGVAVWLLLVLVVLLLLLLLPPPPILFFPVIAFFHNVLTFRTAATPPILLLRWLDMTNWRWSAVKPIRLGCIVPVYYHHHRRHHQSVLCSWEVREHGIEKNETRAKKCKYLFIWQTDM